MIQLQEEALMVQTCPIARGLEATDQQGGCDDCYTAKYGAGGEDLPPLEWL